MFHRSERIMLRPIWPEDWPGIYEGINDEGVVRNLARAPWPYTAEDAREFASNGAAPETARFLVTLPDEAGAPIVGCVGLDPCERGEHELGYWIARPYWDRGLATEAARSALAVAKALGWNRVNASHFLDNPASGRVLLKAGFHPTGQTAMRFSRGRGREARVACFAIDLDATDLDAIDHDKETDTAQPEYLDAA